MKVLYVDLKYDYGVVERGLNSIGQLGFVKSFRKLGHELEEFYYDEYLNNLPVLQKELCRFADEVQPDLIFFCLFKDQFHESTLQYLKSKYTTINWFGDDHWRFESFTRKYANSFTWCITTDQFSIDKYHEIGQKNVVYSQWAAYDNESAHVESNEYIYDVSFVGGYHPYRAWFIDKLKASGINIAAFGHGWPNGAVSNTEMADIFRKSKVNLNISNSSCNRVDYIFHSIFCLKDYLRSTKTACQVKARNFEIPFHGGFQLTDYVSGIEQYFNIGNELVCYSSPEDAVLTVKFLLKNDLLREKIKKCGAIRAQSEHTYLNRLKDILETVHD